nr:hypothetical protein WG70_18295 [Burkholderia oklahomensis EO147]
MAVPTRECGWVGDVAAKIVDISHEFMWPVGARLDVHVLALGRSSALGVQRSAFSVQRSAFSVQRSAFSAAIKGSALA